MPIEIHQCVSSLSKLHEISKEHVKIKTNSTLPLVTFKPFSLLLATLITIVTLPINLPLQFDDSQVFAQVIDTNPDATTLSNTRSEKLDPFDTVQNIDDNRARTENPQIESDEVSLSSSQVSAQSNSKIYGDFNGDGFDDLAIGVPGEGVISADDGAGGVNVLYGSSNGLSATSPLPDQFWTQNSANVNDASEQDDGFGDSLASGDFNGDGKDDLAIGVPGESVDTGGGNIRFAGAVNVLYGSSNGLSATSPRSDQFWTQNSANVNDASETADHFGRALG